MCQFCSFTETLFPRRSRPTDCQFPGVQARGDRSREVPEWLQLFKEGLSGESLDSHNVVVETTCSWAKRENT